MRVSLACFLLANLVLSVCESVLAFKAPRALAIPTTVQYGQVYSELLNTYGRFQKCMPVISLIIEEGGNTSRAETALECFSDPNNRDVKNSTVTASVKGLDVDLLRFKECTSFDEMGTCIEIVFEGDMAVNCTAATVDGSPCECQVCENGGAIGTNVSCGDAGVGQCEVNTILQGAQRTGSYTTTMDYLEVVRTLEQSSSSCDYVSTTANAVGTFTRRNTTECTEGTVVGSAQGPTDPTVMATRTFEVCDDDVCTMLFYDKAGTQIDACSTFVGDWPDAFSCGSCEVCTAANGGIGVEIDCPNVTTSGCKNFPILNPLDPTSAPTGAPMPTSGSFSMGVIGMLAVTMCSVVLSI